MSKQDWLINMDRLLFRYLSICKYLARVSQNFRVAQGGGRMQCAPTVQQNTVRLLLSAIFVTFPSFVLLPAIIFLTLSATSAYCQSASGQKDGTEQVLNRKANSDGEQVATGAEGIWLLEHIEQRMRNLPQLAMRKTKQSIAFQSPTDPCQPALSNPNLLIKPKDLSKTLARLKNFSNSLLAASSSNDVKLASAPNIWESPALCDKNPTLKDQSTSLATSVKEYDVNQDNQAPAKKIISNSPLIVEFSAKTNCPAAIGFLPSKKKEGGLRQDLEVGLLPPTVITGIPLVKLGDSQREVLKALAPLGRTNKESIASWTVLTFCQSKCHKCSMQVFIRHGMVEALRLFDASLLPCDFGVTIGDSLLVVKEKFGEPTFILSKPATITSQNYIYPISQIGFQLARRKENERPKLLSMMVFSVK